LGQVNGLPEDLKELVGLSLSSLGEVIEKREGKVFFEQIESVRQEMVRYRHLAPEEQKKSLAHLYNTLERKETSEKILFVHAFTLMMELMNCCESSYRSWKLEQRPKDYQKDLEESVIFVLTAHPTEARSIEILGIFQQIQKLLTQWLYHRQESIFQALTSLLSLAWETPLTKHQQPTVEDEAQHIYNTVLREDLVESMVEYNQLLRLRLRSWVGGDKDGHPGVDQKAMLASLNCSRQHLLVIFQKWLNQYQQSIQHLNKKSLHKLCIKIQKQLLAVELVKAGDATRIESLKQSFEKLQETHRELFGFTHHKLHCLNGLFQLFKALVVPLELREDSEMVLNALKEPKQSAICDMLDCLHRISSGKWHFYYVQGFIVSMTTEAQHLLAAKQLCLKHLKGLPIPVIPLFETADALKNSVEILKETLQDSEYVQGVREQWRDKLEVMVGYSDSSKGMGVFASRVFLSDAIIKLDKFIRDNKMIPIFFHGSGGSIDRGGGNLQEQLSWWPKSALKTYKATIQGEMVDRSFSTAAIMRSNVQKIQTRYQQHQGEKLEFTKEVEDFASRASHFYNQKLEDEDFFDLLTHATPYPYLTALKIGSRPSKRKSLDSFKNIRAIPWILCWTQTRVLFPTWWGVGSAWKEVDSSHKELIKEQFKHNPVLISYLKNLGFTLAKVDLSVWYLYLSKLLQNTEKREAYFQDFYREIELAKDFFYEVSGQKNYLWFRPWLKESIELRSSMIHPMNMIQIQAFLKSDEFLIRKTVAGIASGMLTTG
jgi:phosphoenolpyruvate carboxylase